MASPGKQVLAYFSFKSNLLFVKTKPVDFMIKKEAERKLALFIMLLYLNFFACHFQSDLHEFLWADACILRYLNSIMQSRIIQEYYCLTKNIRSYLYKW